MSTEPHPQTLPPLGKYRIQTVAKLTGLSPALIRAWEARYGLVVPRRTGSGYRLYSDEDVALLRGAQRLVAGGMAPAQVAALDRAELLRAAELEEATHPEAPEPRAPTLFSPIIQQAIEAFIAFDRARVEQLLAAPLATMPPEMACKQLLVPLLEEVGDRWHRGELSVAVEHFGTAILRGKLIGLLEALSRRVGRRSVLCACPPGERHELGLVMFALRAAQQGWEPIYLGADVPLDGLGDAARRVRPDLVAISLVARPNRRAQLALLRELRAALPEGTRALIGGRGIAGREDLARAAGFLTLPDSGDLSDLTPEIT